MYDDVHFAPSTRCLHWIDMHSISTKLSTGRGHDLWPEMVAGKGYGPFPLFIRQEHWANFLLQAREAGEPGGVRRG